MLTSSNTLKHMPMTIQFPVKQKKKIDLAKQLAQHDKANVDNNPKIRNQSTNNSANIDCNN